MCDNACSQHKADLALMPWKSDTVATLLPVLLYSCKLCKEMKSLCTLLHLLLYQKPACFVGRCGLATCWVLTHCFACADNDEGDEDDEEDEDDDEEDEDEEEDEAYDEDGSDMGAHMPVRQLCIRP